MPIDELQHVLDRIPDARKNGRGYRGTCPSHENAESDSLFFGLDRAQQLVLRCAQCTRKQILAALAAVIVTSAGPGDVPHSDNGTIAAVTPAKPVHSSEAEQAVLGAIFLDHTALSTTKAILQPVHFFRPAYRRVYEAMLELDNRGITIDPLVVLDHLQRAELLDTIGGKEALGELIDCVPTAANVAFHARIVAEYWQQREYQEALLTSERALRHGSATVTDIRRALKALLETPDPTELDSPSARIRLDAVWADEELMRPPEFVVPFLVQKGRLTLYASAEKAGKSTMTGYFASQVTQGAEYLGQQCGQGDVLFIALEEHIGDLARRLKIFGADPKRVFIVRENRGLTLEARLKAIRLHIAAVRPVLVIVDTLMAYSNGLITDANAASQMQPIVQGLTDICHEFNTGFVLVHHAKKADGHYRDSSAIGGAVDIIAEMFLPDADNDPSLRRINRVGRGVSSDSMECYFDGRTYSLNQGAILTLEQRIVRYVRNHPDCSQRSLREAMKGERKDKIESTIQTLLETSRIENTGTEKSWRLRIPSHRPAAALVHQNDHGPAPEWNDELEF